VYAIIGKQKMGTTTKSKDNALVVFETLKEDILNLNIKPGETILEQDICNSFSVSRTPVRTAFQRLSDIGLLDIIPYKGARASLINLSIVQQSIFMRSAIEEKVIKAYIDLYDEYSLCDLNNNLNKQKILLDSNNFAAIQFYDIDSQMHKIWFDTTHYTYLWGLIQNLDVHYTRFKILDLVDDAKHFTEIKDEHIALIKAIENRDKEKASQIIEAHLQGGLRRLQDQIVTKFSSYFMEE
jgi:DNA-binding GntR family transcriptional regulator